MEVTSKTPSATRFSQVVGMFPCSSGHEFKSLGSGPSTQIIGAFGLPLLHTLYLSLLPLVFGGKDMCELLVQVDIGLRVLIPAAKSLVSALQELELLNSNLSCLRCWQLFAFVGDCVTEEVFVYEHSTAVVANRGVEG